MVCRIGPGCDREGAALLLLALSGLRHGQSRQCNSKSETNWLGDSLDRLEAWGAGKAVMGILGDLGDLGCCFQLTLEPWENLRGRHPNNCYCYIITPLQLFKLVIIKLPR